MKTSILIWAALFAESCLAQTFVYSTYANGSVSAYIIVSNGSSVAPVTSSDGSAVASASSTSYPMSTTMTATTSSSIMLPTVPYTGQSLLTGSCSVPKYTGIRLEKGQIYQVPLVGCSDDRPECCPSLNLSEEDEDVTSTESSNGTTTAPASPSLTPTGVISLLSNHPLSICPSDMVDDDPVCCPSGFTKWETPLLGNIACASKLSTAIAPPSDYLASIASPSTVTVAAASSDEVVSPTIQNVVETILFALGLPCKDDEEEEGGDDKDKEHTGLSTGAKAGIGVGAALGALAIIALGAFIYKRRKNKSNTKSESVIAQTDYPVTSKMPPPPAPSSGGWSPSSAQDPTYAGYGQGFVDGVKAMMVPPPGQMSPQSPPPPFYSQPQQQQQRMSYQPPMQQQQPIQPQAPVEVPGHYGPFNRWSAQDQAAELSGTHSTATRSEMGYNPSSSGRGDVR